LRRAVLSDWSAVLRLFKRDGEADYRTRIAAARAQFLSGPVKPLRRLGTLVPPESELELVSAGLGPELSLVALWAAHDDLAAARAVDELEDGSVVARGRAPWAYRAVATWHGPSPRAAVIIDDMDLAFPIVQPLPDGGLLTVASRCRLREDGTTERNASVYGPYGFLERNGTFGDGVEDVQVSPSGRIIASYFDEGVSGANGWSQHTTPPVGRAGLVEFSAMLTPIWRYAPPRGLTPIGDCYAMNMVGEVVWATYFSDFPVVRVDEELAITAWTNEVRGPSGLLVSGTRLGLVGGYEPYDDRLVLGTLEGPRLRIEQELRLTLPDGGQLPDGIPALCRNDRLIVLVGHDVLGLDLADLVIDTNGT
jgi:hypothetical protein